MLDPHTVADRGIPKDSLALAAFAAQLFDYLIKRWPRSPRPTANWEEHAVLKALQVVPNDARPRDVGKNDDQFWRQVGRELRQSIADVRAAKLSAQLTARTARTG